MAEPEAGVREVYVQPGESHLVGDPVIFRTVLGSCVGVTFLVPRLGLGGICHPMLPSRPLKPESKLTRAESCRYVDFTIRDLAQQLDGLGALRNEVQGRVADGDRVVAQDGGAIEL
jgi:chemotaxis protein CheD